MTMRLRCDPSQRWTVEASSITSATRTSSPTMPAGANFEDNAMSDWVLERFFHTAVNCRDIGESVDFYKLLGFEVVYDRRDFVWPEYLADLFGMKRAQGRGVLMTLPSDPDEPMLDLTTRAARCRSDRACIRVRPRQTGRRHAAVPMSDDGVVSRN
jgi:catechol 2,3-dioxygenase-like lactoylglutathione lyase family enzyme